MQHYKVWTIKVRAQNFVYEIQCSEPHLITSKQTKNCYLFVAFCVLLTDQQNRIYYRELSAINNREATKSFQNNPEPYFLNMRTEITSHADLTT